MTRFSNEDIPDLNALAHPGRMAPIIERFRADRQAIERKYPIPYSEVRRERMRSLHAGWLEAADTIEFEVLTQSERIDWLLFCNQLRFTLQRVELQVAQAAEIAPLLPFMRAVLSLEEARRSMDWVDAAAAANSLNAIAAQIEAAIDAAKDESARALTDRYKRTVINRAAEAISEMRSTLKDWHAFYNGYDPLFTWWADGPFTAVDEALGRYHDLLAGALETSSGSAADIIGDPIGAAALVNALAFEMIPYSPEELIAIGEKELAWCEAELSKAASELGFEDGWSALEHVKTLHTAPGGQPELVKQLALEAIDYLDEHDLLTVPQLARETWRLEMMSPEKQRVNPFFLGGEMIQVSFPTNRMTHEQKQMSMRGNNAHFARATVQHELIPGHHMQFFMHRRYQTHRSLFSTPFNIEGWTIYWEFLLYGMGFPTTPENRIGMLFWRMHRCVRVIFSLSFHLERMTPQECITMLVERVGHELANAEAEVRRSCGDAYPALYQCAYLIGGLQMWALRKELVETGNMTERAFHDAVIQENCIPIEMIRADLTGQELNKEFVSIWRFYAEGGAAG